MLKEGISREKALLIIKKRLDKRFSDKIKSTKIARDKIKIDYDNFLYFQKHENYSKYESDALNKLHLDDAYNNVDFTDKEKEKLKIVLNLKQCFRKYYFGTAPQRCCFCGQLLEKIETANGEDYNISTIEHLFPKSKFPQYALCIDNWAPCCSECNSSIKGDSFFVSNPRKEFYDALVQLGISDSFGKVPLQIWKNISFDFSKINGKILIKGKPEGPNNKKAFQLLGFYGLNNRYKAIQRSFYSNLFNLLKCHNISSPDAMESFLEGCQNANMQEMISDFSLNNYPKLWNDFIDYLLYDYNNLTALWEEIKEYNKLRYFKF